MFTEPLPSKGYTRQNIIIIKIGKNQLGLTYLHTLDWFTSFKRTSDNIKALLLPVTLVNTSTSGGHIVLRNTGWLGPIS
jgi:hypothetical protein